MTRKDRINKDPTTREQDQAFEIGGNVRKKGQDPSPDDRARGERSDTEPAAPVDSSRR